AALHDLLHDAPEVRGRLVVVLPRAADRGAAYQVPLDEPADVDRDVALALLELVRDLVERERAALHVEEGEDPALQLVQDAARGGCGADAVDEDGRWSVHRSDPPLYYECLEYSERSSNRGSDASCGVRGAKSPQDFANHHHPNFPRHRYNRLRFFISARGD